MQLRPEAAAFMAFVYHLRATLPYGERPTDTQVKIVWLLCHVMGPNGTVRHAGLAAMAHVHRNTVERALKRMHELGALSWNRITVKLAGWRCRAANAYVLLSKAPIGKAKPVELPPQELLSSDLSSPRKRVHSGGGGGREEAQEIARGARIAAKVQAERAERRARLAGQNPCLVK